MKYASVCSGVEAASLAWMPLGWDAAWFSEIEPFPCEVLKQRFPGVPNLGDMTKIKVENLENGDQRFTNGSRADVIVPGGVDLLVGGTPCQGFSVSGKQGGLQDDRSVLCLTFCKLLADMRPQWFVWENVPGVFSTGGGEDFKTFLGAIDEIGYHVAWRVLDAQYVRVDGFPRAVPQRRRRVFVIGHLGGWEYPAEVLFEPSSLSWDSPPSRIKGKGFTANAERSVGAAGWNTLCGENDSRGYGVVRRDCNTGERISQITGESTGCYRPFVGYKKRTVGMESRPWDNSGVNPTLAANGTPGKSNQELFSQNFNGLVQETFSSSCHGSYGTLKSSGGDIGGGSENLATFWNGEDVATTLTEAFADDRMPDKGKSPCVLCRANDNGNSEYGYDIATILKAQMEKCAPIILNDQGGSVMQIEQNGNAGTLRANTHGNEQIVCVHGSQDPCCNFDHANSVQLNNGLENVVCYAASGFGQKVKSDVSATISTDHDDRVIGNNAALIQENITVAIAENVIGRKVENGGNGTGAQEELAYTQNVANHATVRRLLPVECERLMGFPDNWTKIPWKGKSADECPDRPRYKACGNSMCVNVMRWIGMRIENVERKMKRCWKQC